MISEFREVLQQFKIILASKSPRRQQILRENLQLDFDVIGSNFAEDIAKSTCSTPEEYVRRTAHAKCIDVCESDS
jgi:septum formation protein